MSARAAASVHLTPGRQNGREVSVLAEEENLSPTAQLFRPPRSFAIGERNWSLVARGAIKISLESWAGAAYEAKSKSRSAVSLVGSTVLAVSTRTIPNCNALYPAANLHRQWMTLAR